jgi:hypothetical protein
MSTQKKQLGDTVRINRGEYKDRVGVLEAKEQRTWLVRLESGEAVSVPFPFVEVIASQIPEAVPQTEAAEVDTITVAAETTTLTEAPEVETSTEVTEPEVSTTKAAEPTDNSTANTVEPFTEATGSPVKAEIQTLTVKQLQELAKQKGIGIARTKADFLRIIQKMHPEEDLTALKGPALFNRVTELHISRLRSKEDLQNLLSAN